MSAGSGVSVVVASHGRPALLRGCVDSLALALGPGDELIVASAGAGPEASRGELSMPGSARLIEVRVDRPGKSRQVNAGVRTAANPIVLLTDDDVRVPEGWPQAMAAPFADPAVGLACGPVRGLSRVPGAEAAPDVPAGDAPFETWRFAHGAAMAVRRQAFIEAGGMDERLGPGTFAGGEDHDLVLRVRRRWRVVVAAAPPVTHLGWREEGEDHRNALSYERGGGAVVGAALRRSRSEGWPVLRRRLSYQRSVLHMNRSFGLAAAGAFAAGFFYGLGLSERDWMSSRAV